MTTNAFLIDPFERTITAVDRGRFDSLATVYTLLDCRTVDAVRLLNSGRDSIYVDDNGLDREGQAMFFCRLFPYQWLPGRGLWIGTTARGNDAAPEMTLDYARAHIVWG